MIVASFFVVKGALRLEHAALSIDGSRSVAVSSVPPFLPPPYHPATYVVYVVRFTWTSIGRRTVSSLLPLVELCCGAFCTLPRLLPDRPLPSHILFLSSSSHLFARSSAISPSSLSILTLPVGGRCHFEWECFVVVDAESPNQQRSAPACRCVSAQWYSFVVVCCHLSFDCFCCFHRRTGQWPHRQIVWLLLCDDVLTSSDRLPRVAVHGGGAIR